METTAVPVMEDQDIASMHRDTIEHPVIQNKKKCKEGDVFNDGKQGRIESKGNGRAEEKDVSVSMEVVKTTKRKRGGENGEQEDQISESRKVLKRKKGNDVTQSSETKKKIKQRFILFVGSHLPRFLQRIKIQL